MREYQSKTSDPLPYDEAKRLIQILLDEGEYKKCLLIAVPFYTFLRNSDYKLLKYGDFKNEKLVLFEQKTKNTKKASNRKPRIIKISSELKSIVEKCRPKYAKDDDLLFACKRTKKPFSITYVNQVYAQMKIKYNLNIDKFSSHSARKGGITALYNKMGQTEAALILCSQILCHSSISITRLYIGLTQKMQDDAYESL